MIGCRRHALTLALACGLVLQPWTARAEPPVAVTEVHVPPPRPPRPEYATVPPPATELRWCERDGRDACRSMKIGGATAIGLGLAALGLGLGLVFVDSDTVGAEPRLDRVLRPAGGALIGVGMLVSTFGAFMLGEAIHRKRARDARFAHITR